MSRIKAVRINYAPNKEFFPDTGFRPVIIIFFFFGGGGGGGGGRRHSEHTPPSNTVFFRVGSRSILRAGQEGVPEQNKTI